MKVFLLIILFISPSIQTMEGFFKIDEFPAALKIFYDSPTLKNSSRSVGKLIGRTEGQPFFLCSGVIYQNYFVTAQHCLDNKPLETEFQLQLISSPTQSQTLKLLRPLSFSTLFDIAVFKIDEPSEVLVQLPSAKLPDSLPSSSLVYSIGFPQTIDRTLFSFNYPPAGHSEMRITVGVITEANKKRYTYCFYNNFNKEDSLHWQLQPLKECPGSRTYRGHNMILADTDMTYGMSGSPLFNERGEWIGIGSRVLGTAGNYQQGHHAIYSKSINWDEILKTTTW